MRRFEPLELSSESLSVQSHSGRGSCILMVLASEGGGDI